MPYALDDADIRFLQWVKDRYPYKAVLQRLARKPYEFNAVDLEEAARVLAAAATTFLDEGDRHPLTVLAYLSGLSNGYGCWLDNMADAIAKTRFNTETGRARFLGAFHMATNIIFALEHPAHLASPLPQPSDRASTDD